MLRKSVLTQAGVKTCRSMILLLNRRRNDAGFRSRGGSPADDAVAGNASMIGSTRAILFAGRCVRGALNSATSGLTVSIRQRRPACLSSFGDAQALHYGYLTGSNRAGAASGGWPQSRGNVLTGGSFRITKTHSRLPPRDNVSAIKKVCANSSSCAQDGAAEKAAFHRRQQFRP